MPQAAGVFKQVAYKAEVTFGVKPAASAAHSLRRVSSDLSLTKETYASAEITPSMQTSDFRHGVRSVAGSIQGQLSPKTYADFIATALRRDFAAVTAVTGASLTIAGSGPTYTITRAAGDWLAANGVKKGDVIRLSVGTLNAANINRNLHVLNATATVLTVRPLNFVSHASNGMVAEGPIASCTVTVTGKKTWAPISGHTNKSFSIEHYFPDLSPVQSEVFTGCYCTQVGIQLPPTGIATIAMQFMGEDVETATTQYFTSPTAATTTGLLAAVNGEVAISGSVVTNITGLQITIDSPRSGEAVVGSNVKGTLFPGRIAVSGQFTAYFEDAAHRDAFLNETEIDIAAAFTADNSNTADFVAMYLARVKLGAATKSDGEGGIVQTFPFTALLPTTGGAGAAFEQSLFAIQDSQA